MALPERPTRNLKDLGVNLRAALNALDDAQKGMSLEEIDAMNKKIVSGEEDFTVAPEEAGRRRAAIRIADLRGVPDSEGEKIRKQLEEAAAAMDNPTIRGFLNLLGKSKLDNDEEQKPS